jgi:DNA-binding NarL/FixJ family response regulator
MIRVILADDHHLVRRAIRTLLEKESDIGVVAEAEDGHEALDLVERLSPDVLIADIAMPRLNGIQAADQIHTRGLNTRVIILSMHCDDTLVRQALHSGVRGYLVKRSVAEELPLAVRAAYQDELYLSPALGSIISDLLTSPQAEEAGGRIDRLSAREREVLQLIAEGHTNREVAEILHLSTKTVEKHRANLMSKLGVDDVAGLVRMAIKHNVIFLDD